MKKYRLIKVRNPRLRFIRHNLRRFLLHLSGEKMRKLLNAIDEIFKNESLSLYDKVKPLHRKLDEIKRLRRKAPLYCQGCGSKSLDMIYHVGMEYWLCEFCYRDYREFERKRGKDYREIYPDYERI